MVQNIITYPDKQLKQISKIVKSFDTKLHFLLDDMYSTIESKEDAVGLSAIQIGIDLRVIVINIPSEDNNYKKLKEDTLEIINPMYIEKKGICINTEGCLSVPDFFTDVKRAEEVSIEYFDRYGSKQFMTSNDFLATVIQHEIDHLNGELFIEKLSYLKRKKFEKEWKKKLKEHNIHRGKA